MTEHIIRLSRSLVIRHNRDGRRCYDPEAKRELIDACRLPGVSVARVALEHSINANLLRKWIDQDRRTVKAVDVDPRIALPAFAAVVPVMATEPTGSALSVILPNGVKLELRGIGPNTMPSLLTCLAGLPCFASTRD